MRILLSMNVPYAFAPGGANKANRTIMEMLAARGHTGLAVVPAMPTPPRETLAALNSRLAAAGCSPRELDRVLTFTLDGVAVVAAIDRAVLRTTLAHEIRRFAPDRILISAEDPSHVLLQTALEMAPTKTVYLVHTTSYLPFGPDSFFPSAAHTASVRRARSVVTVSQYAVDYLARWGGVKASLLPLNFYGSPPFPTCGRFDGEFVTMINACAVKGISIFCDVARAMPEVAFAAIASWGTTEDDRRQMASIPNVRLLEWTPNIEEIFGRTRVLLVPSLWGESWGRVAVEAMLRRIPVVASDFAGLREATLGAGVLVPVTPISSYLGELDGNLVPRAVVPPQDAAPWVEGLRSVLRDMASYDARANAARDAAHVYVEGLSIATFEQYLQRPSDAPSSRLDHLASRLASLSAAERASVVESLRASMRKPPAPPPPTRSVRFTLEDVDRFADASRDRSPLHVSEAYARKTMFGGRVVHGVLAGLACLGRVDDMGGARLKSVSFEFVGAVSPSIEYNVSVQEVGPRTFAVRLLDGSRELLRARAEWDTTDVGISPGEWGSPLARSEAAYRTEEYLRAGLTYAGAYAPDMEQMRGALGTLGASPAWLADDQAAGLLACSYLVGMEVPGKQALLANLEIEFQQCTGSGPLDYRLRIEDSLHGLLELSVDLSRSSRPLGRARIGAFARKETDVPTLAAVEADCGRSERMHGRVAVVTGVSRGLGAALALALALQGCTVLGGYSLSDDDARRVQQEALGSPGRVSLLRGDASSREWCNMAMQEVQKLGRLDLLVCNAAPSLGPLRVEASTMDRLTSSLERHVAIVVAPLCAMLDSIRESRGRIVLVSSSAVVQPVADWPHYVAAKLAAEGLVRVASLQAPEVGFIIARPPRMQTALTNSPLSEGTGSLPVSRVASRILQRIERIPHVAVDMLETFD